MRLALALAILVGCGSEAPRVRRAEHDEAVWIQHVLRQTDPAVGLAECDAGLVQIPQAKALRRLREHLEEVRGRRSSR